MKEDKNKKGISVMIIDDNEIDLFVASHLINSISFSDQIQLFNCAEDGLSYLDTVQHDLELLPDYIFVDIYMPLMSGFDFLKAYNYYPEEVKNQSKIYIISSTTDEGDKETILKDKNVVGFKEKPINREFLEILRLQKSSVKSTPS